MRHERVLIASLTLVALALRLAVVDDSLFGDELFTYEIATRDGPDDVLGGVAGDLEITPPLYFLVAWAFQLLGDPGFWLRFPSILAGTLLVPVTWMVGRRTLGPPAAVVGAALVAFSPFAIFYSTEARAYALMTLLAAVATYALLRAVEEKGWGWWGAYALAVGAALYTHYTAVFAIGVHAFWVGWVHRHQLRRLLLAYGGVVVAYVPWIPEVIDDRGNKLAQVAIAVLEPFGADTFIEHVARWSVGTAYVSLDDLPGIPPLAVLLALLAVAAVTGARHLELRPGTALVGLLAIAAPIGAALWTVLAEGSIFIDRNLLVGLPPLLLALGAVLTAPPPRLALPLSTAFVAVFAWLAIDSTRSEYARPNYEAAGNYVADHVAADDAVLDMTLLTTFGPPSDQLRIHLPDQQRVYKTHIDVPDPKTRVGALSAARGHRLYVLAAGDEPDLPEGRGHLRLVETKNWPGRRLRLRLSVFDVDG